MPTIKPRILVTLEPEIYEVLRTLAGHQKRSMSEIVREVIDVVAEPYSRLNTIFKSIDQQREHVVRGEEEIRAGLAHVFRERDPVVHVLAGLARDRQLDFYDQLVESTGVGFGGSSDEPDFLSVSSDPPPSDRGVRSSPSPSQRKGVVNG